MKPSKHNKSNGSLDEGYTTDDNYDYRRFAAFPKDLYDEPGSIVSSLEEPEYRIPEDFITSQMSVTKNNFEGDYLRPSDVARPQKPPRIFSNVNRLGGGERGKESFDSVESHYDEVGSSLNNQIEKMCHAYDEVGQALQDKIAAQEHCASESDDDYDEPHDSIRNLPVGRKNVQNGSSRSNISIVENPYAVDTESKLEENKL